MKYETLGDIAEELTKMRADGMTIKAIEYVLAKIRDGEPGKDPEQRTNLEDAEGIIAAIDRTRATQRELKSAFARSDLDGGAKAALTHPLYLQAAAKLDELHDDLMGLI